MDARPFLSVRPLRRPSAPKPPRWLLFPAARAAAHAGILHPLPGQRREAALPYLYLIDKNPPTLDSYSYPPTLTAAVDALTCILQSVVLRSYLLTTDFQQLAQLHAPYPMGFLPTTNPPTPLQLLEACQWQPSLARYPEVVLPIFFQYRQTKPLRHDNRLSLAAKLWLLGEDWSAYYFILGRTFNPLTLSPKEAITLAQHPLVKAALLTGQPLNPVPHTLPPQPGPMKLRFRPVTSPAERIAYLLSSETPFHVYLLNKSIAEMQKVRYTKSDLHIRTDARRAQRNRQPYMPLLDLPNRYAQTPLDAVEAVAFQALLPLDSPTRALISRLT